MKDEPFDITKWKAPTREEMREVWKEIDDHLARKRRKAIAEDDARRAEMAAKPCPAWPDAAHCYAQGRVGGLTGGFTAEDSFHLVEAKQCKCGARIRPNGYKP